jgi:2-octaprenyl-6-methoxyphenol hydroxylase
MVEFDVIIVGGGLVGASLACALKNQAFKIALIDKSSLNAKPHHNFDARALALSLPSIECLQMLDVWPKICGSASIIKIVHVSKQGYFGVTKIRASEHQLSALGYVVNADDLNNALNQVVETLPHVTLFRPEEIVKVEKMEQGWSIQLSNQKKLHAKILVGADGSESPLRKQQGIEVKVQDYQQTAIVANIALNQSHQSVAYERFLENGSIAMLPCGENCVKCVWIIPSHQLGTLEIQSDNAFLAIIQREFGNRLGFFTQLGKRVFYPLKNICAETLYSDRFVLIGNAANTVHPIAAQGFNLGLRDAATLAEMLVQAQNANQDIGSVEVLRCYADRRINDHQAIRYFTDSLAEPHVFQWLGILASEWVTPFKRRVAERGLGRYQNLPKLCRGVSLTQNP